MSSEFGNRLKELRLYNKLKQTDIASKLFVNKSTISNWEKGKQEPSIEDIKHLANILNSTTDELLDYEQQNYNFEYHHKDTSLKHSEIIK